jgi:hypothetical protein
MDILRKKHDSYSGFTFDCYFATDTAGCDSFHSRLCLQTDGGDKNKESTSDCLAG